MTKSEIVYRHLKEKILANELKPGEPISIQNVAAELAISKIPVREAIKKLESIGLVETIPNVGARVKKLDLEELEQIMLIRRELETLAARLAADHIDQKNIEKLYLLIDAMEKERQAHHEIQYAQLNKEFHCILYRSSGADFLANLIEDLWDRSERTRWVFSMFPERFKVSNEEHYQIVKSLEAGDGDRVAELVRKQKSEGFLNVIKVLKEYETQR